MRGAALAAMAGAAVGFVAALALPARHAPVTTGAASTPIVLPGRCTATLSEGDVARLERRLVAAVGASTRGPAVAPDGADAAAAGAPDDDDAPALPDAEAAAAAAQADDLVGRAVVAGQWTPEDVTALRALTPHLTPEARTRVFRTVLTALNAQRLRTTSPILF